MTRSNRVEIFFGTDDDQTTTGWRLSWRAVTPVNCKVGDWTAWGKCSETCDGGTKTRAREVIVEPEYGGKRCPALEETMVCNTDQCPVDCKVGDWKPWGECSLTCGGGTKTRARDVIEEPKNGGALCSALEETMDCNIDQCPLIEALEKKKAAEAAIANAEAT